MKNLFLFLCVLLVTSNAADIEFRRYYTDANGNGVYDGGDTELPAGDDIIRYRYVFSLEGTPLPATGAFQLTFAPFMGAGSGIATITTRNFTGATTDLSPILTGGMTVPGATGWGGFDNGTWYQPAIKVEILSNPGVRGVAQFVPHRIKSVRKPGTVGSQRTMIFDVILPMELTSVTRGNYTVEIVSGHRMDAAKQYVIRIEGWPSDFARTTPPANPPTSITHRASVAMPTPAQMGGTGTKYYYWVWKRIVPGSFGGPWASGEVDNGIPVRLLDSESYAATGGGSGSEPPVSGDPPPATTAPTPTPPQAEAVNPDGVTTTDTGGDGTVAPGGGGGGEPADVYGDVKNALLDAGNQSLGTTMGSAAGQPTNADVPEERGRLDDIEGLQGDIAGGIADAKTSFTGKVDEVAAQGAMIPTAIGTVSSINFGSFNLGTASTGLEVTLSGSGMGGMVPVVRSIILGAMSICFIIISVRTTRGYL